MRSSLVMSLIGAASMAAALLAGCGGDDAKPASSQAGQSCLRTADCADGLSCIANVCYKTVPNTGGTGGEAGATGAPPGPVLGGPGESCTSRRDCESGLACFNQRCGTAATGEGGGTGAAQLGDLGETCRVKADCVSGLICVPSNSVAGIGVCDQPNNGYQSTGKVCAGECKTAADCCELPPAEKTGGVTSCIDITNKLVGTDCTTTTDAGMLKLCFLKSTFCTCAASTWKCDTATSQCVYSTPCSVAGNAGYDTVNGCPRYSRIENHAIPTCNLTTSKCEPPTVTPDCKVDSDCDDNEPEGTNIDVSCASGDCTCYQGTHKCYLKCAKDLDCSGGYKCDTTTKVCTETADGAGECTNDLECAAELGSAQAKCVNNQCKIKCTNDQQCNNNNNSPVLASTAFGGNVCSAQGYCEELDFGCSTDNDCIDESETFRTFCIPKPVKVTTPNVKSAVGN